MSARPTGVLSRFADDFPGDLLMKTFWILVLLCSSVPALALRGGMEKAVVSAMRKVPCMGDLSGPPRNEVPPEMAGYGPGGYGSSGYGPGGGYGPIDNGPAGGECVEYTLRSERVRYVIRPHHAILLMLGSDVYIKLVKDELLLRTSEAPKDIHCAVVSMALRSEDRENEAKQERPHPAVCLSESGAEIPCTESLEPLR
jgi:hypothetical protein